MPVREHNRTERSHTLNSPKVPVIRARKIEHAEQLMKGKISKEEENAKMLSQLVASQEALKDAVGAGMGSDLEMFC